MNNYIKKIITTLKKCFKEKKNTSNVVNVIINITL